MARTDLVGLLTGIGPSPIDPTTAMTPRQAALQRGAQYGQGFRRGVGALTGADTRTTGDLTQEAIQGLDFTKPEDLKVYAQIQLSIGDTAGAAQTAARIQAMKQAELAEKRTGAAEDRAEQGLQIRKEQLAMQKTAAGEAKERAERGLQIREEQLAMQKTAAGEAKEREDALLAQSGVSRALFAEQARENGMENLAVAIETNSITLEKAGSLLYGTSNAVIKAPTADEEKAFDHILNSSSFAEKIKDLKTSAYFFFETLSDKTKQAIYFKAKELMTRQKMSTEEALEQAITSIKLLDQIPEGSDTEKVEEQVDSQDAFATIKSKP
jgi:hypothetical protein